MVMVSLSLGWRQRCAIWQYRRGLLLIERMAYRPAIAAFNRALSWHPDQVAVLLMRGTALERFGNERAALADYDHAIALLPDCRRAHGKRGLLRYHQGDEAGALADWQVALAGKPIAGNAEACVARALIYLKRQEQAAALADLDRAIAIDPNHAVAYWQRGNLREQLGDLAGAVQDWELAVANDFSLDGAKRKLQAAQEDRRKALLGDRMAEQLMPLFVDSATDKPLLSRESVQVQIQISQITVQLHRPLGIAVNYGKLAETIRQVLVKQPQEGVNRYRMELYVQGSHRLEWSQGGGIYEGEPEPPSHWPRVALTTVLMFPVGVPAAVFAWRTEQLFEAGNVVEARRTSRQAKGLCNLGLGMAGLAAIAAGGYGAYLAMNPEAWQRQLESAQHRVNCLEVKSRARCVMYTRPNYRPKEFVPGQN